MRASAVCENAGVPSSSLTCEGFLGAASATAIGLGFPHMPLALVPGHVGTQSKQETQRHIVQVTVDRVIDNLTRMPDMANTTGEPGARDIVCRGSFDQVNRYFYKHELSDGLPIVPPTRHKIEQFLAFADRDPDEVLGVILPDSRAATLWSVAVNGVMAGCRPEYMPLLAAIVEVLCDPKYGVEHSGNTPGGDALIIVNGPIIEELEFNYTQGVLRDGFIANTSIGRFLRLYLRNVAGFLLHKNDKVTHGTTWRVVLAENEDVLARIGWEPTSVEMGFQAGDNTVTLARYTSVGPLASVSGSTPEQILPFIADSVWRIHSWQIHFTQNGQGTLRPLVILSPILAEMIAGAGWSKLDVKRYLFEHTQWPASAFEHFLREWTNKGGWSLAERVRDGDMPALFHASDDPDRRVPIVWKPEDFMIAVSGDPLRNNAYVMAHNAFMGYPVGKKIRLPRNWETMLAQAQADDGPA
jgi:hypothetical protein